MARSRWIKAVMASVVSGGLALGQPAVPSTPRPPDDPTGRIITVNEPGKPGQKCRVVKWWVDPQGHKVLVVESLDSHEVMTIRTEGVPVMGEPPAEGRLKTLRTTIFHWRKDGCPPTDAPQEPRALVDTGCSTCTPGTSVVTTTPRLPIITTVPSSSAPICTTCPPRSRTAARRPAARAGRW